MLCRGCSLLVKRQFLPFDMFLRSMSEIPANKGGKDPAVYFFNEKAQNLMKHLTRMDMEKVYRFKKEGQKVQTPEYKFMTTEQLEKEMSEMRLKADQKLQMPPFVSMREDVNCVLATDKKLKGYDSANYVFTDITYGVSDRDRLIVVRDTDGTLRKAFWEERHRMNQTYFERAGRKLKTPKMFEDEYLKDLLRRGEYVFILDRACAQFDPDDPDFIRVRGMTYDHINETKEFELLRSTRHFGPLAFYLAWNNKMENLLIDILNGDRLEEAVSLIELYHMVNPSAKSAKTNKNEGDIEFIKAFAELDSSDRSDIELALQNYAQRQFHKIDLDAEEAQGH